MCPCHPSASPTHQKIPACAQGVELSWFGAGSSSLSLLGPTAQFGICSHLSFPCKRYMADGQGRQSQISMKSQ